MYKNTFVCYFVHKFYFLIQNERNLANWFIYLGKFPKLSDCPPKADNPAKQNCPCDLLRALHLISYSGNTRITRYRRTNTFTKFGLFSYLIEGVIEENQIDILNWSLDNEYDETYLDGEFLLKLVLKVIENNNVEIFPKFMVATCGSKYFIIVQPSYNQFVLREFCEDKSLDTQGT